MIKVVDQYGGRLLEMPDNVTVSEINSLIASHGIQGMEYSVESEFMVNTENLVEFVENYYESEEKIMELFVKAKFDLGKRLHKDLRSSIKKASLKKFDKFVEELERDILEFKGTIEYARLSFD